MKMIHKRFFFKLITLVLIFILIDKCAGVMLNHIYEKCKTGVSYQEFYIINKTHQKLLIFGNSRASFTYVPEIFSNELGLSTYNTGEEGIGIYYYYAVLLATLERYRPELIILEIDYHDFYEGGGRYGPDVLKHLAPFYGRISAEFDSLLSRNWYDPILFQSNLYKYNSSFFHILTGHLRSIRPNYNGYRPAYENWPREMSMLKQTSFKTDPNKLLCIEKFIQTAQKNNIQIVLTVSPYYLKMPDDLFEPLAKVASKYKVILYNHASDQRLLISNNFFKDETHLNDNGARLYSLIVAKEIFLLLSGEVDYKTIVTE
jgi:hypothetical protein